MQITNSAVIYENTIVYALHDINHHIVEKDYRFKINVKCEMSNRDYLVDYMHKNLTTVGRGHFAIHLNFYSDSNYQHQFSGFPPSYMIGDLVYVKVLTNIRDYGIKMRISECSTKPSEHSSSTYIYYLIRNG